MQKQECGNKNKKSIKIMRKNLFEKFVFYLFFFFFKFIVAKFKTFDPFAI